MDFLSLNDADPDVRGARKFESLGQRDDACLAATGTAVDFHRSIGIDRIEARVTALATALKEERAAAPPSSTGCITSTASRVRPPAGSASRPMSTTPWSTWIARWRV
ncbi:MAG TPA: hypothetical protein VLA43_15960 [Longimicrobiales bacterium]|nr:hypothetical protein [Longimicrobiales bacterium]